MQNVKVMSPDGETKLRLYLLHGTRLRRAVRGDETDEHRREAGDEEAQGDREQHPLEPLSRAELVPGHDAPEAVSQSAAPAAPGAVAAAVIRVADRRRLVDGPAVRHVLSGDVRNFSRLAFSSGKVTIAPEERCPSASAIIFIPRGLNTSSSQLTIVLRFSGVRTVEGTTSFLANTLFCGLTFSLLLPPSFTPSWRSAIVQCGCLPAPACSYDTRNYEYERRMRRLRARMHRMLCAIRVRQIYIFDSTCIYIYIQNLEYKIPLLEYKIYTYILSPYLFYLFAFLLSLFLVSKKRESI